MTAPTPPRLSLIIPALNAAQSLDATLDAALDTALRVTGDAPAALDLDLVVIDGGSTDATRATAQARGARLFESAPGRGRQLAAGARHADADWLLFVHADTRLPAHWADVVTRFIADPLNAERAGYFRLRFDVSSAGARRVAALANWRARTFGLPYGDQGLLIHRTLYDAVGGYGDLALMEDVELVRRIGPMRLRPLPATVVTSAAKYQTGGWWARPARHLACLALYLAGAPQGWIERLYR